MVSGILVILSADLFERLKIDDPAGAFHVHGTCGIFGTLMIGIFGQPELGANGLLFGGGLALLGVQAVGVVAVSLWMGATSFGLFTLLKALGILRVHAHADEIGIDSFEHGAVAYPDTITLKEIAMLGNPSVAPAAGD